MTETASMDADLYRELVLDHYRHPRGQGHLESPTHQAEGENPLCGDHIEIELAVAAGKVTEARFLGHGCAISQAAASMLIERLAGMEVADALAFDGQAIQEMLGVPLSPLRLKCGLLPLETLRLALSDG